ncbi:ATPase [Halobellus sp. Atlit-31R]|nr:ATPase [Halobellus sp. Atlit-31R]
MAQAPQDSRDLTDRFIQFYRKYYRDEIGTLAQQYPNEQRSLYIDYEDLYKFDTELAEDYRQKPDQIREYAEEALRLYDLPADVKLGRAHVRLANLPETVDIRSIRVHDDHIGRMIAVQGIVRKATDVRPKITEAAFECQRCGTMTYIPQSDSGFQEPHECQGCERQGPFHVDFDQSEFIDAQKVRVQESPEGLRGGETPQSIDIDLEDDVTGKVTAGDHVTVTGVLHIEQQTSGNEKTPIFDLYMDGVAVEIEDEEFEDMDITDEDVAEIVELSNDPDIYEKMVGSVAPSIYGYEQEKLAMILQLFSGVTKHLPDGSRIRGDLHMLLIGDPGTGKCVDGDTAVTLADGSEMPIRALVEDNLDDPKPVDDGVWDAVDIEVPSMAPDGSLTNQRATKVWKREAPEEMYQIRTASGKELTATPSHPLFVQSGGQPTATKAEDLTEGQFVATPRTMPTAGDDSLDVAYRRSKSPNAVSLELPDKWTNSLSRLIGYVVAEGHVESRADHTGSVRITNNDEEILSDAASGFESLGVNYSVADSRENKQARVVRCNAGEFVSFLEHLDPALLARSAEQRVPDSIKSATAETKREFLRGYVDAEGHVAKAQRELTVASTSRDLLEDVRSLLLSLDISPSIQPRQNGSYRLRLSGDAFQRYVDVVGFVTERKRAAARTHSDQDRNTNVDVVPAIGDELREIRESLALAQSDCGVPRTTYQHYERGDRNPGRDSLTSVLDAFERRIERLEEIKRDFATRSWAQIASVRRSLNVSQEELAAGMGVEQTTVSYYERTDAVPDGGRVALGTDVLVDRIDEALSVSADVQRLRALAENDIRWDRIESIETCLPEDEWVYDLEVAGTHSYLSNSIVSHNSAMLQYIRNIAPRSVYTSGKGSSSAGLTAAAVRDDFGDGQQWTLEAGALVLADKGIAAVDELDKMRCVTGETLVHTTDGLRPIRELAHEAAASGAVESLPNGRTIREDVTEVWTLAPDGTLVTRPVTAVHEYEAPDALYDVTLESGESVSATADHPFFVFEDGERVERATAGLEPGDWVYVPESIPEAAADGGSAATDSGSTAAMRGSTATQSGSPAEYPAPRETLQPAKGAILGYLVGDGNVYDEESEGSYGIRFTNKEEQLLSHFESVCRAAYEKAPVRHPSEQRDDGVGTVRLHGKAYVDDVLDAGMNLETHEHKRVPVEVTRSSRATKAAFVRALADSEATVDDRAVELYSSSYELLLGTKMLLSEFGVRSQIQTRSRADKRDLYVLAITAADSLAAYEREIGFTLDRKQSALETATERTTGDRAILDVLPESDDRLRQLRNSLRLHQSECGLDDATYCNFECGDANPSLRRLHRILEHFAKRRRQATADLSPLDGAPSWSVLKFLCEEYHVSQRELATGTEYTQQRISRRWGRDDELRETITERLTDILQDVAATDLSEMTDLVDADVRWRRVDSVEPTTPTADDDRIPVLKRRLADELGCDRDQARARAAAVLDAEPAAESWTELQLELERHGVSFRQLATKLDVAGSTVSRWFSGAVDVDNFDHVRAEAFDLLDRVRDRIASIHGEIERRDRPPKVYDLTVQGTHNFVANGMIVHNSEDRSAMHEALEQQSISVSKAGINATLKSRCSLLGAANPKYGRFDQYEPIGEQIDLEPALISRFDLIFTVTDNPDPESDAELAEHIINTNYAGELHTQKSKVPNSEFTDGEVENATEEVTPVIDAELLRKYIAYAKRNCYPTMTDEAKAVIRDFYVDFRAKGADDDAPVPVTARKLEALVRLSEASARLRLSDTVERADAVRVTEIVESCLRDIGMDPETGEFDADIVETGTSKNQRDRIKDIKHLIEELEDEYEDGAPVEEVIQRAGSDLGLEESKAEDEIENLKRKGELYEPRQNYLRTT